MSREVFVLLGATLVAAVAVTAGLFAVGVQDAPSESQWFSRS